MKPRVNLCVAATTKQCALHDLSDQFRPPTQQAAATEGKRLFFWVEVVEVIYRRAILVVSTDRATSTQEGNESTFPMPTHLSLVASKLEPLSFLG
jgi:hypothetical protein